MDGLITRLVKSLNKNIVVHIYSHPHFAIETLLAFVLCIAHCLLIFEINNLYRRTNATAAVKLKLKHPQLTEVKSCTDYSISSLDTQISPQKIETSARQSYVVPSYKRLNRKLNTASHFGWDIPTNYGESRLMVRYGHGYNDRVNHFLSISPSEYVRKYKEKKHREACLRYCIHFLISLLDKVLNDDNIMMGSLSKEAMENSINAIKENFKNQFFGVSCNIGDFCSPSLHSLLKHSVNKKSLKSSLEPRHSVSFSYSGNEIETREYYKKQSSHDKVDRKESLDAFSDECNDECIEVMTQMEILKIA
ncbi:hypothetical protein JTB14_006374 [Gonioctena quinquepunctata]|nr:hypothetical protein JTB14_006374 [Gonioctena quinquepunctata]